MVQYVKYGAAAFFDIEGGDDRDEREFDSVVGLSGNRYLLAREDGDGIDDIYAQFRGMRGAKIGEEFTVNTEDWGFQGESDFARLKNGWLVSVWTDWSGGTIRGKPVIKAKLFTEDGQKLGPELFVTAGSSASVAALAEDRFVVTWTEEVAGEQAVKAQLYSGASKIGSTFQINTSSEALNYSTEGISDVATLAEGGFVVSWIVGLGDAETYYQGAVRAQAYDANGNKVGAEVSVGAGMELSRYIHYNKAPSVSGLANGNYVVSWRGEDGIKAQIVTAAGTRVGATIAVNGENLEGYQAGVDPTVLGLSDGSFIVSWEGRGRPALGRIFDSKGAEVTDVFDLGVAPPRGERGFHAYNISLSELPDGGFVASWRNGGGRSDSEDPYRELLTGAQVFLPDTAVLETKGKTITRTIAEIEAYQYIVTFNNPTDTGNTVSLRLKDRGTFDLVDELEDLRGADIRASDNGNTILTGAQNDTLRSGAAADMLNGGAGNDRYYVNDAEDVVVERYFNSGDDTVLASVSYSLARGVLVEHLHTNSSGSTAAINLYGNEVAQTIKGNRGANKLDGRGGNDTLNGGGGRDTLTGGSGRDKFVFDSALNSKTNVDRIANFSHNDDTMVLDNDVFAGLATGTLAGSRFKLISSVTATKGVDSSDRILYDRADGDLYFDRDGSGSKYGRVKFAEVTDDKFLGGDDFLVI